MKKYLVSLAAAAMTLAVAGGVEAANAPASANAATVTQATLPSGIFDGTSFFPATCAETQVVNGNQRKETFQCSFDAGAPASFVCDTSRDCLWFSDFDGAEAKSTHFVITPSGVLVGWATY